MLPKTHRLTAAADFIQLRRQAWSTRGAALLVRALVRSRNDPPRAAIIIAKKTFPKAVTRNAIRRKIRHQLARILPLTPLGTLALVIVGKAAEHLPSAALQAELRQLFQRARLLPPRS